ncbi:theronine dehydrogenase [Salmonella enterica subsp. salamae]|nr:theronine dehydrogenase [Salmonella enterica subsp. salamae]
MKWRYSLRWKLPGTPCPGPQELVSEVVEAGQQAPESVMSKWVAGAGYAICVDFLCDRPIRRWSVERKPATRRRNLEKRIHRTAPLFAAELIERELASRPEYFQGKTMNMPPKGGESC